MKQICVIFFLSLLTCNAVYGQICDCPKTMYAGTQSDTVFQLSNGKTIALCGWKHENYFSEFVLTVCGQDTIIDFWGAVLNCILKVNADTLLVEQIERFPTGKGFQIQETVWTTEKIYFLGQKISRKVFVNKQIKRYSQDEVQSALKSYETASMGLDESKMQIANKLFIATISGSKTARQYFMEFKNKFGVLDGAFAEEYSDLKAMLELWDINTINN